AVRGEGVSEQARPRDERAPRSAVAACPPPRILRLLRLALDGAWALDAGAPTAAISSASRSTRDPPPAGRASLRAPRHGGGRLLRAAESQELRADERLGMAAQAAGGAAQLGFAGGAPLGAGSRATGRYRDTRALR